MDVALSPLLPGCLWQRRLLTIDKGRIAFVCLFVFVMHVRACVQRGEWGNCDWATRRRKLLSVSQTSHSDVRDTALAPINTPNTPAGYRGEVH